MVFRSRKLLIWLNSVNILLENILEGNIDSEKVFFDLGTLAKTHVFLFYFLLSVIVCILGINFQTELTNKSMNNIPNSIEFTQELLQVHPQVRSGL